MIDSVQDYPVSALLDIEGNLLYAIPRYQRAYTWGKNEWEKLFDDVQENDNRVLDGYVGDTISTAFFDFTVNDAHTADSYGSLTPAEGNTFCIVNVTVHNTMRQSLPMFDTDFVLFWGPGDSDGSFPVTHDDPSRRTDKMLEESYYIGINETVTGDLVYEMPKTHDPEGILYFEEYFENGEYGDYYTVTFPLN